MRNTKRKRHSTLAKEWDSIAQTRSNQIESGQDISHSKVLLPTMVQLSSGLNFKRVLDAGCGTGSLTRLVARKAQRIVGVDMSSKSIALALRLSNGLGNVEYEAQTIEAF